MLFRGGIESFSYGVAGRGVCSIGLINNTMYVWAHKREKTYKALVSGLVVVYVLITCAVPLLHRDDCPVALHSGGTCPACMFLANSHSGPVHCDSLPGLTQTGLRPEFGPNSVVVVASSYAGPILLRGPPAWVLS
jgi:hypothetical protein